MNRFINIKGDKIESIEVEKDYIVDKYLSKENDIGYSVVITHLNGTHPFMKNIKSNRTYYIIRGEGIFYIEEKVLKVKSGDMLSIIKNTKYAFKGNFDAVLIDCPSFNSEDDIIYNEKPESK